MTRHAILFVLGVAASAGLGACSKQSPIGNRFSAVTSPAGLGASTCTPATPDGDIPLPIAPPEQRVDLVTPTFSNPTRVTNPLFPISRLSQVVLVGLVDGVPFRAETTLMPGSQRINVGDGEVRTLTSQYVAYLDRRIHESALDWYAQADDGSVWYFGEDVSNYEEGRIVDKNGTWITCKDGPMAMIMPAHPRVGDVYRVENIYPRVFEEIEVTHVNQTVEGPLGPVAGAFTVQQLHLDGSYAPKVFAPGYGEFSTGSGTDIEALAIASPTDASFGPTPRELETLLIGARKVFRAAGSGNWRKASSTVNAMQRAWARHQSGRVPRLLKPLMAESMDDLARAVSGRQPEESRQLALDVSRTGLDLLLQYRSRVDVDVARLGHFARQLMLDAEAKNQAGIDSDLAILQLILSRLTNLDDHRGPDGVSAIRRELDALRMSADRGNVAAVLNGARRLESLLRKGENDQIDEADTQD